MSYLLAAEADKIQDFIFRSSRLREVSGASWLLTKFCQEGVKPIEQKYGAREIVNDGGSFRLAFDSEEAASAFGQDLAEFYRKVLGGSLSVAEPVLYDGDFRRANKTAGEKLRRAKDHRQGVEMPAHMPYAAYCASCGVALAVTHGYLAGEKEEEENPRYLCQTCQDKANARNAYRMDQKGKLIDAIERREASEHVRYFDWPEDAGDVGGYDLSDRNYVAYLVADGNGMGQIFGQCNETQIRRLSKRLPQIVRESLAIHTERLIAHLLEPGEDWTAPVMPLILGGDDVFVLLPAPYALDFARQFCLSFETKMAELLDEPEFADLKAPRPTMSAAVVICKSKYPYSLAHRRGEELLEEAKRMSKRLATATGEHLSTVNFEVILGNRLAGGEEKSSTTLRPYWVIPDGASLSEAAAYYGVPLQTLLAQRLALKDVPNKRLHELRRLFSGELPEVWEDEKRKRWENRLQRVLARSGDQQKALQTAFQALGDDSPGYWRFLQRGDESYEAQGFLDLLETWHFAQDLKHPPEDYEPQEEGTA